MCRSLIRYAAAALAALAFAAPAHAEFVRSAQLFDWLGEAVKRGGSFKDTTIALGYVSGVHDSLPEGLVCLPPHAAGKALLGDLNQVSRMARISSYSAVQLPCSTWARVITMSISSAP